MIYTQAVESFSTAVVERIDDIQQSNSPLSSLKTLVKDLVEFCANSGYRTAISSAEEILEDSSNVPLEKLKYQEVNNVFDNIIYDVAIVTMQSLAQSNPNFQRRMASLYFFNEIYKAMNDVNSFLPPTSTKDTFVATAVVPLTEYEQIKRVRTIRVLKSWIQSVNSCVASNLSDTSSNSALATNAIISANALFKPTMKCIASAIEASEDDSATELFEVSSLGSSSAYPPAQRSPA